jgi:hypothetical protein
MMPFVIFPLAGIMFESSCIVKLIVWACLRRCSKLWVAMPRDILALASG